MMNSEDHAGALTANSPPHSRLTIRYHLSNTNHTKTKYCSSKPPIAAGSRRASDSELFWDGAKFTYKNRPKSKSIVVITSPPMTEENNDTCPSAFLESIISRLSEGSCSDRTASKPLHHSEFIVPTSEQIEAYNNCADAFAAVRACDVETLRRLHSEGLTLGCCNKFGESLLHMACRRSSVHVVSFLLKEANVSPRIRDDYGRTPLHDACWRGSPEYDIVELLLHVEPRLAFVKDVRGHQPFQYARREHWAAWRDFLNRKESLLTRSNTI